MDDAQFMRGFEGLRNLLRERQRVGKRDRPMPDAIGEGRALDQFEHERMRRAAVFKAIDSGDVWMAERGEHLRFSPKSRQPVRIGHERAGQDLQCDVAIELGVASAIDFPHATSAHGSYDFVGTEPGARSQGQLGGVSILDTRSNVGVVLGNAPASSSGCSFLGSAPESYCLNGSAAASACSLILSSIHFWNSSAV